MGFMHGEVNNENVNLDHGSFKSGSGTRLCCSLRRRDIADGPKVVKGFSEGNYGHPKCQSKLINENSPSKSHLDPFSACPMAPWLLYKRTSTPMGQQYNKLIKRRRRKEYLRRKQERIKLLGKTSGKKGADSKPAKKAAPKKTAAKKAAPKKKVAEKAPEAEAPAPEAEAPAEKAPEAEAPAEEKKESSES